MHVILNNNIYINSRLSKRKKHHDMSRKSKRDCEPCSFLEVNPLYSPLKSCCHSATEKYTMEKTFS